MTEIVSPGSPLSSSEPSGVYSHGVHDSSFGLLIQNNPPLHIKKSVMKSVKIILIFLYKIICELILYILSIVFYAPSEKAW